MIKRISALWGLIAFILVLLIGFSNGIDWFTVFIRAFIGFGVVYLIMSFLAMIVLRSIVGVEVKKRQKIQEERTQRMIEENKRIMQRDLEAMAKEKAATASKVSTQPQAQQQAQQPTG